MTDTRTDTGAMADGSALYSSVINVDDKLFLVNRAGSEAVTADVLCMDTANDESFVFASSSLPHSIALVVPSDIDADGAAQSKSIATSASGWVFKPGAYCPAAAVDEAVDAGEFLEFGTSKKFTGTDRIAGTDHPTAATKAIALETIGAAGSIPVLLLPVHGWHGVCCKLTKSSSQSLPASAITPVTWDGEDYDSDNLHSLLSNTSRITIPETVGCDAIYRMVAFVNITKAGGISGYLAFRVNGSTIIQREDVTGNLLVTLSTVYKLSPGDYVEVVAYSATSGGTIYGTGVWDDRTFEITQIGEVHIV